MKSNLMTSKLAVDPVGGEWEKESQPAPKEKRTPAEDAAIALWNLAVEAHGKSVSETAFDAGMSTTHLADHIAGRRVLAMHRLVRLVERNRNTAIAVALELLRIGGIRDLELRPKRKMSKDELRKQMQLDLERDATLLHMSAERTARRLKLSREEILETLEEPTNPRIQLPVSDE